MTPEEFNLTLTHTIPPLDASPALVGLWHDAQGAWDTAHEAVQNETDHASALVHAYLHRKEGDLWNARYWYTKGGRAPFKGTLQDEWKELLSELLKDRKAA